MNLRRVSGLFKYQTLLSFLIGALVVLVILNPLRKVDQQEQQEKVSTDSLDTVKVVEDGKTCYEGAGKTWSCIYEIGEELKFKISNTGKAIKVVINITGYESGDFYIPTNSSLSMLHEGHYILDFNCIPVRAGLKTLKQVQAENVLNVEAYVSPVDGRAFPEQELCEDMMMTYFEAIEK